LAGVIIFNEASNYSNQTYCVDILLYRMTNGLSYVYS